MITVELTKTEDYRSIKMIGHAGYNPGKDIVCSAASTIICMLIGWMNIYPQHLKGVDAVTVEDGNAHIAASGDRDFLTAFDVAEVGLQLLATHYPEYVKVSEKIFSVT